MSFCSNCGHDFGNDAPTFCPACGQDVSNSELNAGAGDYNAGDYSGGEYNGDYSWDAPPPSPLARAEELLSKVSAPVLAVAGQAGQAFQSVLDDPRLRSRLPGGSLTLLGLGLVGLGLLLSVIPVVAGIGFLGSVVMVLWGALVAVNEWRILSRPEAQEPGAPALRPLPHSLATLPRDTRHPGIAQTFALLTCTNALLMLGFGPISLVWILAAVVLGYDQGWRYFADNSEDPSALEENPSGFRLHRWVVAGAVLCTFALLLPWGRGSLHTPGLSGAEQPLSTITQFTLLLLACSAVRHRGLSAFHPLLLIIAAVWLALWFFLMMSVYTVGPWFFLPGMLVVEATIVRHLMPRRRGGENLEQEAASDMDMQG
ncbi:zinc ribbon domain-containing protein [Archangium lansingense]|uniref:zinc ribbon domain-containing protein n=1 Tax=Archangium lansingense TaxID=2995310 RepID=UPI003B794855